MARNNKKTSNTLSHSASDVLRDPRSSKIAKRLAGSALSQSNTRNQTGADTETLASRVMKSDKYNSDTKTLAGTVLSQSNKKR